MPYWPVKQKASSPHKSKIREIVSKTIKSMNVIKPSFEKKSTGIEGVFKVIFREGGNTRAFLVSNDIEKLQEYFAQKFDRVITATKKETVESGQPRDVYYLHAPGDTVSEGTQVATIKQVFLEDVKGTSLAKLFVNPHKPLYITQIAVET